MADPSPARYLAPLALFASFIALVVVVGTAGSGDDDPPPSAARTRPSAPAPAPARAPVPALRRTPAPPRAGTVYVVKRGDLLSTIAEQTGVPSSRLLELNPEMEPQSLVPGQRLKIR